jgi:hypothetical protein
LPSALLSIYPDVAWEIWRFENENWNKTNPIIETYWNNLSPLLQTKLFVFLKKKLNIESIEDWYHISNAQIDQEIGPFFLKRYDNSIALALLNEYPKHPWELWKFRRYPNDFWKNKENHKVLLSFIGYRLNITTRNEWYSIENANLKISEAGGSPLLEQYSNNYIVLLCSTHEYSWNVREFNKNGNFKQIVDAFFLKNKEVDVKVVRSYIDDNLDHLRSVVDQISANLGIKSSEDWYSIKLSKFASNGGDFLLKGT